MSDLYLGLMSGTSVDALDIALCSFEPALETLAAAEYPFPDSLRSRIHAASSDRPISLDEYMQLEREYTEFCASATRRLLTEYAPDKPIRALGFHGQTLRHRPDIGCTLQMANPSLLAERTGIDVVADFRRRDLAAGGEGAPLVPAFHQYLIAQTERPLGILNIGGIANLSLFVESSPDSGFDTGPGNTLMDQWTLRHLGRNYDNDGEWAASGSLIPALLQELLTEAYFARQPPKSTGRELFNLNWLDAILEKHPGLAPADVQRTLLELTAHSIVQAVNTPLKQLVICGGGARNRTLIGRIAELLPDSQVSHSDEFGWPAAYLEAIAFAWLAKQHLQGKAGNLPEVTGAGGYRILGGLYPA